MSVFWVADRKRFRIQIHHTGAQGRVRKSKLLPAGTTRDEAQALHDKMSIDLRVRGEMVTPVSEWPAYVASLHADRASWIYKTLAKIRGRTKANGRQSSITAADLRDLLLASNGRCAVTGIAFHTKAEGKTRPFFHSIDRIDSRRGYVQGNLRVVCYAVNIAMLHWGEEVFAEIATGYIINRYCAIGLVAKLHA